MCIGTKILNNCIFFSRAETDLQSLQLHMDRMAVDDLKFATAFNEEQDVWSGLPQGRNALGVFKCIMCLASNSVKD